MSFVGKKQGNGFFFFCIKEKPCFLQWTQHSDAVKLLQAEWRVFCLPYSYSWRKNHPIRSHGR